MLEPNFEKADGLGISSPVRFAVMIRGVGKYITSVGQSRKNQLMFLFCFYLRRHIATAGSKQKKLGQTPSCQHGFCIRSYESSTIVVLAIPLLESFQAKPINFQQMLMVEEERPFTLQQSLIHLPSLICMREKLAPQGPSINQVVSRGVKNCQFYIVKRQLRWGRGSKSPILRRHSLCTAPYLTIWFQEQKRLKKKNVTNNK